MLRGAENLLQAEDLRHQYGNGDDQLVDRADGAPQMHRRDLGQIHRREAGVQARVYADQEPADDDHLVALGRLGAALEDDGQQHQYVVEQQTALPTEAIRHPADKRAAYHSADAEYRYRHRPDHGHLRLRRRDVGAVRLHLADPVLDELRAKVGAVYFAVSDLSRSLLCRDRSFRLVILFLSILRFG